MPPTTLAGTPTRIRTTYATTATFAQRAHLALLGALRALLGFVFLWAFLDKTFGWGVSTPPERAWLAGGSPTRGFLGNVDGPFAWLFQPMAGHLAIDALFMVGLLGIGLALVLGIGMRVAAASGATMMMLMWAASLPIATNPFVDDHVIYAIVLLLLPLMGAGRAYGLGGWWAAQPFVRRHPMLK